MAFHRIVDRWGYAAALRTEDKHIFVGKRLIVQAGVGEFGNQPHTARCEQFSGGLPVPDRFPLQRIPVIHSGPLEFRGVDSESERFDQPQLGPQRDTSSPDIAGILRYFRLEQNDVQHADFSGDNRQCELLSE